jgi:putative ABC transport system substrate-binding protein
MPKAGAIVFRRWSLLRLKVDVIVAVNTPAAKAAQNATKTVPIVIMRVADPVKAGLVRSLAYPGANVTGVSFMPDVLGAKRSRHCLRQFLPCLASHSIKPTIQARSSW